MPWTERQTALLAEMGVRLWSVPMPELVPESGPELAPPVPERKAAPAPASHLAGIDADADTDTATRTAPAAPATSTATRLAESAAPVDARGLDWPALRSAVAACTACELCHSRTQTVFGAGHPRAHWLIVGEAPGEQEDALGEPFVGPSGRLLDNMLRAIGVARPAAGEAAAESADPARSAYIANTLKCRPPGNRNPTPGEMQRCEGFLMRQIELVQPKLVLAMGQFAAQGLLRTKEPVGRLRGRVHRYQGVPLIVTYHPAYLLRSPQEKARAWADLCLALDTLQAGAAA